MCRIEAKESIHDCMFSPLQTKKHPSFFERISDYYLEGVQDFSQYLFRKGWVISSLIIPSIFGEFKETFQSTIRRLSDWKFTWKQHGFYNAGDPSSLAQLQLQLEKSNDTSAFIPPPVLLFHGIFSSPDIWLPWADELEKAKKEGKIGHVITLQLPNDLEKRMQVVYQAIAAITKIYEKVNKNPQVDLIGHSLGGYAAHLAAFSKESINIKDENGVERRWHEIGPEKRNPQVRKVISVAAPTWLCSQGQRDETTQNPPNKEDIYPWKVFSDKTLESSFTKNQIDAIRSSHIGIYDIIATQDAISSIVSPLPETQVYRTKHGHVGASTCRLVCRLAISILCKKSE